MSASLKDLSIKGLEETRGGPWSASGGPPAPRPTNAPGRRNLDCPNYLLCLELAVERWWEHFHCQACGLRRLKDPQRVEDQDIPSAPGWEDVWREHTTRVV
jgi:hypothetical protein